MTLLHRNYLKYQKFIILLKISPTILFVIVSVQIVQYIQFQKINKNIKKLMVLITKPSDSYFGMDAKHLFDEACLV